MQSVDKIISPWQGQWVGRAWRSSPAWSRLVRGRPPVNRDCTTPTPVLVVLPLWDTPAVGWGSRDAVRVAVTNHRHSKETHTQVFGLITLERVPGSVRSISITTRYFLSLPITVPLTVWVHSLNPLQQPPPSHRHSEVYHQLRGSEVTLSHRSRILHGPLGLLITDTC